MTFDYDYLIVGSGFGGSVSALRLAEKGWRVAVVEQGRRIGQEDIRRAKNSVHRLLWSPGLGMKGYFTQRVFRDLMVVGGAGVGGGSLVWGAVMLEPKPDFYRDPRLQSLGVDWESELEPCFKSANRMLGVAINPRKTEQDNYLEKTALALGVVDSYGPVPNAINFEDAEQPRLAADDEGPKREACSFCGGCLTGCEFGAKNSLDYNYLYHAERRGVTILSERKADRIEPLAEGGYRVQLVSPGLGRKVQTLTARKVILSSGVLGTLELLFKNRDAYKVLPNVSPTLGRVVRTNSEAITAVLHPPGEDMTDGTAISSDFHPDSNTHITQNRFDRGYRFMRYLMGPMVDDASPFRRALKTAIKILCSPLLMLRNLFMRDWEKRITVFTVMQDHDNHVGMSYRRRWWSFFRRRLVSQSSAGHELPSYLAIANRVTREYARVSGGTPMSTLTESLAGMSTTAHILSGCPMGTSADNSVIDTGHEVHGHPGLFVVDGASIPANIGVNPSLTIAAMAERFAALQPYYTMRDRGCSQAGAAKITRIPVKMRPMACQGNEKKVRAGWGLLVCLGLILALAGADVPTRSESEEGALLWVNDYPISAAQLSHAERRLSGGHSGALSESERRVVLDLLIDEELLLQRAESLGILDSAPGVRKAIVQAAISEIVEDFLRRPFDEPVLEQFYLSHSAVFEHPGRRAIAALRFDNLTAAQRAADAYANGSGWADLAAMPEAKPVRHLPGSPLPAHVLRRYLGPGLANVALTLRSGEISDPVESAGSAYLIKLITVRAPSVPAFSEILPDVRAEYLSRGRETALADKLAQLWHSADIQFNPQLVGKLPISDKDHPLRLSVAEADVPAGQNTERGVW